MITEKLLSYVEWAVTNPEAATATALLLLGSADKVALVALKTIKNVITAFGETFGKDGGKD